MKKEHLMELIYLSILHKVIDISKHNINVLKRDITGYEVCCKNIKEIKSLFIEMANNYPINVDIVISKYSRRKAYIKFNIKEDTDLEAFVGLLRFQGKLFMDKPSLFIFDEE